MASSEAVDEVDAIATALERECPWTTVSGVLDHEGWRDVVGTIKAVYPAAYEALRQEAVK